ncbi:MAG: 23S rRNA (guanosine(2251)-2'-O)-methyltransferase RlmB [Candidatus Dormibacteraeota bacterium]|nr:23S rRNA (guanosine(2251)-2'-O)-methyltransferase RlmB [Candidatus Dormibacteraeota bacterium]
MPRPPDIIYGRNPVLEAFRAGRPVRRLLLAEGLRDEPRLKELRRLAAGRDLTIESADRHQLDDIAHSEAHQGVVAYVTRRKYWELEPMAREALAERGDAVLLMLDSLQDPQNLGTLSRTAEATGVGGIVLSHNRSPEVTPSVVKASAGAAEYLRYARVANLAQATDTLKALGFWIVGLAGEAAIPYTDFDYRRPLVLIVGAEGEGMHQLLRKKCDALVRLPMLGQVGSLNAAVAGSILLYEVIRQRQPAP